jgi:NitT/TauT family transport system permease protein
MSQTTVPSPATDLSDAIALEAAAVVGPTTVRREAVWRIVVPPLLVGAVAIGLWYVMSEIVLEKSRQFLLEPPHRVWSEAFAQSDVRSEMLHGLWSSGKVAFWGLLIAIVVGFGLAVLMSQARFFERAIFPYAVMLQAIPILAIVPLIGFWFGYGFVSRVFVCVLIALFPIVVNTLFGLLSAEQGMHDLFTLHGASRITRLRKLMFPAALPAIFAGLRISAGLSVIGAIVGDFFFGQGDVGIGQLLKKYASRLEGESLIAAVILSCGLGVAVFVLFGWISNRAVGKWSTASRGRA